MTANALLADTLVHIPSGMVRYVPFAHLSVHTPNISTAYVLFVKHLALTATAAEDAYIA